MKARAVIGIADVHARTLPYSIKALQDFNAGRVVIGFFCAGCCVFHEISFHSPLLCHLIRVCDRPVFHVEHI